MQITGVQSVGARSLGSVSVTVSDPAQAARAVAGTGERENATSAPRALHPEAVVFPRDGKPLDQRPVDLRNRHATARYREDGKPRERARERAPG
jgi:hypothetical protein